MGCISPIALRLGNKIQFVPCGKCNFCLASKRADWSFRLFQEMKVAKSGYFLTLTYNDEEVPWCDTDDGDMVQSLCKRDLQLFTKRLRKASESELVDKDWPSLRYYAVGEYGDISKRPHYHAIMFNLSSPDLVAKAWTKGHVKVGDVNPATIHYVTKYVINRVGEFEGRQKPFSMISNRSGALGISYVVRARDWHKGETLRNYVQNGDFKMKLPRLFKDKIFSAREKEKLAKDCIEQLGIDQRRELYELSKVHPDPYGYLYERIVNAYNLINVDKAKKRLL